jgi:hypothetical protein
MHDMMHQGALIAPRPLLMMHGRADSLFPVPGYEEFQSTVGKLYAGYGKPDSFGNVVVETGHADSDFLREQAVRFFDRHLLGVEDRKLDMDYSNAPAEQLTAFGGKPPAGARNYRVHEIFTTREPSALPSSASAWKSRAAGLTRALREKVFAALPALPEQPPAKRATGGSSAIEFDSEADVTIHGLLRQPNSEGGRVPGLLYIASDGEDPRAVDALLISAHRRGTSVRLTVYPRGVGEVPWDKSFWKDTLRNAMHVGHTVDSMRLYDVLRGLQLLRAEPRVDPDRIMVMGRGVSAGLAIYAAILDPRVHQAMVIDPPASHTAGPLFLNVLRHTDLPEAAALLAPRRLNFYARIPPAYEYTRQIYKLAGAPGHVYLAMNIEAVLEGRYDYGFASGY